MTPQRNEFPPSLVNARVAAVQMLSTPRVEDNLQAAAALIAEAAGEGAQLVALPEYFPIMGMKDADKIRVREEDGCGPIQDFLAATARRLGLWLVGGSVPGATVPTAHANGVKAVEPVIPPPPDDPGTEGGAPTPKKRFKLFG